MSGTYYYYVASLPLLIFDGKLPLSLDEFKDDCMRLLSDKDGNLIKNILEDDFVQEEFLGENKILDKWILFDRSLRNEWTFIRAHRLKKDPHMYFKGDRIPSAILSETLNQASKETNLIESEKIIDRLRWQFLEDIVVGSHFSLSNIIVYALQLKILDRYSKICSEETEEKAKNIFQLVEEIIC